MGYDNTVTVAGNITRDPELRFTQSGTAVTSFDLAWNRRRKDQEDEVSFFDVSCFRQLAENVSESLHKGDRVVVYGHIQQRRWENADGDRRSKVELLADDVAPSLKWATADVTKIQSSGGYRGGDNRGGDNRGGGNRRQSQAPARGPVDGEEEPF